MTCLHQLTDKQFTKEGMTETCELCGMILSVGKEERDWKETFKICKKTLRERDYNE